MCKCLITSVREHELNEKYRSSLRRQDVRTKEIDKIDMLQCFRPGDIILARIVSDGTHRFYFKWLFLTVV